MSSRKLQLNILQLVLFLLILIAPISRRLIMGAQFEISKSAIPFYIILFILLVLLFLTQRFQLLKFNEKPSMEELISALHSIKYKVYYVENHKLVARPVNRFKRMGSFGLDKIEIDLEKGLILGRFLILNELNSKLPKNKQSE